MAPSRSSAAAAREASPRAFGTMFPRQQFFHLLTHDDRNSFYYVASMRGGVFRNNRPLRASALADASLDYVSDWYVTHNGFTGAGRDEANVRQINAVFLDVDWHDAPASEYGRINAEVVSRIDRAVEEGALPKPTMSVGTGRGIHLYYVLERSLPYRFKKDGPRNDKGLFVLSRAQRQLADILDEVLDGVEHVDVDRKVFDHPRVSRIPDTVNTKTGTRARLLHAEERYYDLAALVEYRPKSHSVEPDPAGTERRAKSPWRPVVLNYNRLLMGRLAKLADLQAYRGFDCRGSREMMCFVFYNTAVQIHEPHAAWDRLVAFNGRFAQPLDTSELEGIRRSVSSVRNVAGGEGYYILKSETIRDMLGLTKKEIDDLNFFMSKKVAERIEAKRKTREKKESRGSLIVELHKEGRAKEEIASLAGCSKRTVQRVLKEAGLTRAYARAEKPAARERVRHVGRISAKRAAIEAKPSSGSLRPTISREDAANLKVPIFGRSVFCSDALSPEDGVLSEVFPGSYGAVSGDPGSGVGESADSLDASGRIPDESTLKSRAFTVVSSSYGHEEASCLSELAGDPLQLHSIKLSSSG